MSFLGEIKRRKIFQIAAVYAVVAWLLVQIAATVETLLNLPDWADTFVIVLLAIGFPIALIISWAFNLTPEGLIRDPGVALQAQGRTIEYLLIGLVAIAVGWLAYRVEFGSAVDAGAIADAVLPNSVAVLPFENLSPDADDAYFAAGLHEEVLNQLAKLSNLNIIARTTMRQYANTEKSMGQIAAELNVATVMEGSVRYANGRVRVTTQLIDGRQGVHLWSDTYDRDFEDIFAIESDIAMSVANAMAVEFSLTEQSRLEEIPTNSTDAYALLLSSIDASDRATREGVELALERLDRATRVDPDFSSAWNVKAQIHAYATAFFPERAAEHIAAAEDAARRALAIDPDGAESRIPLAMIAAIRGEWRQAAGEFEAMSSLWPLEPMAAFQFMVGHTAEAHANIVAVRERDPLNSDAAWWIVSALDTQGDVAGALAEYERGRELFGPWAIGDFHAFVTLLGDGEAERAFELARSGQPSAAISAVLDRVLAPESAAAALRSWYADNGPSESQTVSVLAAAFGDEGLAFEALRESVAGQPIRSALIWRPIFRAVRQHREFRDFLREFGLVAYWQQYGWPDLCRPIDADEFECR